MAKKHEAKTVLIIEDEVDIQTFACRVLELEGYRVLKASDGEMGMEIIRENRVDLVLLNLRLPGRDGWSILREMKHDTELSKIPVIVITAIANTLHRRRTLNMGANKYLIKPMSAHSLAKTITSILHKGGRHQTINESAGAKDKGT
jgi:DNA-binding response OmpR family regulator